MKINNIIMMADSLLSHMIMQVQAACVLTNIVSGTSEHTKVVIDYGALPLFVQLLTSGNDYIREFNLARTLPRLMILFYLEIFPALSILPSLCRK